MNRSFLHLAYDGTSFHGWQKQNNAATVQEKIELGLYYNLQEKIDVIGCGRTDTGVHARNFYAHFDHKNNINYPELTHRLNRFLNPEIAIYKCFQVKDDAHARFDATARLYHYYFQLWPNPFVHPFTVAPNFPIELEKLNEFCKTLLQHTDFQCFSKTNTDVSHYNCTIHYAKWELNNDKLVFHIKANRFLRGMVRALVGTMTQLLKENKTTDDFTKIIESKERCSAGPSAKANGLFLEEIFYPNTLIPLEF